MAPLVTTFRAHPLLNELRTTQSCRNSEASTWKSVLVVRSMKTCFPLPVPKVDRTAPVLVSLFGVVLYKSDYAFVACSFSRKAPYEVSTDNRHRLVVV